MFRVLIVPTSSSSPWESICRSELGVSGIVPSRPPMRWRDNAPWPGSSAVRRFRRLEALLRPGTDRPYMGVLPKNMGIPFFNWVGFHPLCGCFTKNSGGNFPNHPIFNKVFHYKLPSILGETPLFFGNILFSRGLRTIICYGIPWIREDFFPYMNDWWCFFGKLLAKFCQLYGSYENIYPGL